GKLDPGDVKGNQQGRLQFKFYPEGKSKSDQHVGAEGWFHVAPDGEQQDWHFKFTLPKDRNPPRSSFRNRYNSSPILLLPHPSPGHVPKNLLDNQCAGHVRVTFT